MIGISLEAKMVVVRHDIAEKHFFDLAQPTFFPKGFSVTWRNPGHWDITAAQTPGKIAAWKYMNPDFETSAPDSETERAFRIRGEKGDVQVYDERWDPHRPHPREPLKFRSVLAAMVWIMEELMQEPPEAS